MWLVLAQDGDPEATWVADGLRARTTRPVVLVTADVLVHGCRWEHRIGVAGTRSRLVLEDGVEIRSDDVGGVVNRLLWLSTAGFEGASPGDRTYASAELFALALSWLAGLGPRVLNRPSGIGLGGTWRPEVQWRALARGCGLAVVPFDSDEPDAVAAEDDRVVLVVDGRVVEQPGRPSDSAAHGTRARLVDLQRASGHDLLEVRLAAQRPALRSISSLPTLSRFGAEGLDALAQALAGRGAP